MNDKHAPGDVVAAHNQLFVNRYVVAYHEHPTREGDPHHKDFEEWKRRQRAEGKWRCHWAADVDDDSQCDTSTPLEAHHSVIELALRNNIDFKHLEHLYPGISDPATVGAWIDGPNNLKLYCAFHHRSENGGVHHLDAAMWEAAHVLIFGTLATAPKRNG